MAFADTWMALQSRLTLRQPLPNRTIHSGLVGESFEIDAVPRSDAVYRRKSSRVTSEWAADSSKEFHEILTERIDFDFSDGRASG